MIDWQWECFERYTHSGVFNVTNPGPLLSPISAFKITRNSKLDLVLETHVIGETHASNTLPHPRGQVRLTTETVEFGAGGGLRCTAHGVLPFSISESHNADLVRETTQKAQVHSLTALLQNDATIAYTIDWLGNLNKGTYVWQGTPISVNREIGGTLRLGHGKEAIELSASDHPLSSTNYSALEVVVGGVRLFICDCQSELPKGIQRPGYIFYVGNPSDEVRTKIRQILSFCLGNYLVYLGSTMLSEMSEVVAFSAMSPPSIGRVTEIHVLPPARLANGHTMIADPRIVAHMANAIYAHYDELQFNSLSWAYWHAMCAPVHMAAGHFGAAIESLQRTYIRAHPGVLENTLITDSTEWARLRETLLESITEAGLEPEIETILANKVRYNLNQAPQGVLFERMLEVIGITIGDVERGAWNRRNRAAHGNDVDVDSVVPTIMETKLLKIILHRIILKITGASDSYYDDYTIGHEIRDLMEPVPSPTLGLDE